MAHSNETQNPKTNLAVDYLILYKGAVDVNEGSQVTFIVVIMTDFSPSVHTKSMGVMQEWLTGTDLFLNSTYKWFKRI